MKEHIIPDFLLGGGEMGERIRNFDWSATPLGPPQSWNQSLKTSVSICLNSNFPIALYWGKDLILIYNDAWSPIPGSKHPQALGKAAREVWPDIWKEIAPQFEKALHGEPGGSKDALLPMQRHGYVEECYFDFTFTPVRGEGGHAEGIFNAVIETTYRVLNERRSDFLNRLAIALSGAKSKKDVYQELIAFIQSNNKTIAFCYIYSKTSDAAPVLTSSTHRPPPGDHAFPFKETINGKLTLLEDVSRYVTDAPRGYWPEAPKEAVMFIVEDSVNMQSDYFVCGLNARRRFDDGFRSFIEAFSHMITNILNTINSLEREKKRNTMLQELDEAKTIFFSNISHEFRTPLTLMLGPLEQLLSGDQQAGNDAREHIQTAHRNALRLLKLVNTLLDFSKIEAGKLQARFSAVNIVEYTESLVANFRSMVDRAGLQLTIKADDDIPMVYLDKGMWEKIVFNIMSNAFKYTLQGTISVVLTRGNTNGVEQVVLRISDTGVGIPADELPKIFDRFHRVHQSHARSFEGTGIGLSLVKELVKLHHGTIHVESEPGKGTTFFVCVPLGTSHLLKDEIYAGPEALDEHVNHLLVDLDQHSANAGGDVAMTKPLVLIVDDNSDMRLHLTKVLQREFNTVTASNGAEALQRIGDLSPALIISDVMMPVMDGIELVKAVKKDQSISRIPVILLTARAGEEMRVQGYQIGADDYLVKPFSSRELIARIHSQLKAARQRKYIDQQLQQLFEQAPTAIMIVTGNRMTIDLVNRRAREILLRESDELLGRSLPEVFPEFEKQGFIARLKDTLTRGVRHVVDESPVSFFRQGSWHSTYVKFIYEPLQDAEGNVYGVMILGDDIASQVLARKKMEESNRDLKLSAALIDSMADAVVATETSENGYKVTRWNRGAEMLYGYKAEEVMGRPVADILLTTYLSAEDETEAHRQLWNGMAWQGEVIQRRKSGEPVSVLASVAMLKNEEGKVVGAVSVNRDITERKRAAEALRLAKEQLEITFRNVPAGIFQFNRDGNIEYINDVAARIIGYSSASEVLADRDLNRLRRHQEETFDVFGEDGELFPLEKGSTALALKLHKQTESTSKLVNRKTGQVIWLRSVSTPVYDEAGALRFVLTTATDVTDQRTFSEKLTREVSERTGELLAANKALQKSQQHFQLLFNISPVAKSLTRATDGTFVDVNPAFEDMFGRDRSEVIGRSPGHLGFPDMPLSHQPEAEVIFHPKGKRRLVCIVSTRPLEMDNVRYFLSAFMDITAIRDAEQKIIMQNMELEKANKELESFNYIASHDLQEPLRKIQTFVSRLESLNPGRETVETYYEKINAAASRMQQLIEALLQYSRILHTGEQHEMVDLNKVLDDVLNELELRVKETNAVIKADVLPFLFANRLQMHQLFLNLIGNSLKFTHGQPRVEITYEEVDGRSVPRDHVVERNQKFVRLQFRDNGIGFEPQYREQIFTLFQRLHLRSQFGGTGVGLSIVKKIVDQHHGAITADSTGETGSIFTLWLPLGQTHAIMHADQSPVSGTR